jgi:cytoskeletal protein CcmA (bactofilin family)
MAVFNNEPEKGPAKTFFWRGQNRKMTTSFSEEPEKDPKLQAADKAQSQAASMMDLVPPAIDSRSTMSKPTANATISNAEGRAFLDKGCKVNGKVSFDGPARIDGQVEGEISGSDTIAIGESAVVNAQVRAETVVIAGKIAGDVIAGQRLEIQPSARVVGNLTTPVLVIHEGALFKGHCSMQVEGVRDELKTTTLAKDERLAVSAQPK